MEVDERERRLAQNEALFREVNERVETLADRFGPDVPMSSSASARMLTAASGSASHYRSTRASAQTPSSSSSCPCITRRKSRIWSSRKALTGSSVKQVRPANTSSSSIHAAGRHFLSAARHDRGEPNARRLQRDPALRPCPEGRRKEREPGDLSPPGGQTARVRSFVAHAAKQVNRRYLRRSWSRRS
jgi:hypothetical protein